MGRGGRSVWLPYLSVTIVASYPLSGETPYFQSVRNLLIILLDRFGWRWDIKSINIQLVVKAQTQVLRLAGLVYYQLGHGNVGRLKNLYF